MSKEIPKSCSTCEHRDGHKCNLSGFNLTTERKYPTTCGEDFRGWRPRMGIKDRIIFWFHGAR